MGKKKFGYWQLCPRCGGNGMIHNPNMNTTASQLFVTCDVCHGNKIIARPLLNSEQEDERSVATEADSSNAGGDIGVYENFKKETTVDADSEKEDELFYKRLDEANKRHDELLQKEEDELWEEILSELHPYFLKDDYIEFKEKFKQSYRITRKEQ